MNLVDMTGLYQRLTQPLANVEECNGTTLVVAGNVQGSFLASVIKGPSTCGAKSIPRMPDNCSTNSTNPRACLNANEIALIDGWISSGAPQ